uniref:Janus kinase 1 n=1 Tax=Molossus molossus TaxID=27622 RepID=A0A7J8F8T2_MOLMO|nr:Janus kinase 1 [Molossus molossus]
MIMSSRYGGILQRSRKMATRKKKFQMQPLSLTPAPWSICLLRDSMIWSNVWLPFETPRLSRMGMISRMSVWGWLSWPSPTMP